MTDAPDNDDVKRALRGDLDVDLDGERDLVEDDLEEDVPAHLDAAFEEPIADVIDQRREVLLEADDYAG